MASLPIMLLSAMLSNLASSSPAPATPTFAGGEPLGVALERPADFIPAPVPSTAEGAGEPVLSSFISFSIELASLPDFAGNKSHPNTFTANLLQELANLQGNHPHIRVGGNTQDIALFDPKLSTATNPTYTSLSPDYPTALTIGPPFFESYATLPSAKFIHGFNLAGNSSAALQSLTASVPYACKALGADNFLGWELGNEPDLYRKGGLRPSSWNEEDYVKEWSDKVEAVRAALVKGCGEEWGGGEKWAWIGPSFAGAGNGLEAEKVWGEGLGQRGEVKWWGAHGYAGGTTKSGITLAETLLNHSLTLSSLTPHTSTHTHLTTLGLKNPYILSSITPLTPSNPLTSTFGAALWTLDFALASASTSMHRLFFHTATNHHSTAWQPLTTSRAPIGTHPPFYGVIAAAAALGDVSSGDVRVARIALDAALYDVDREVAYAVYANGTLRHVVALNLAEYHAAGGAVRGEVVFNFTLPESCAGSGMVGRLRADGSDAVTGVSFDGMTFNHEVGGGKGVALGNVSHGETVWVGSDGGVGVPVEESGAAVVRVWC